MTENQIIRMWIMETEMAIMDLSAWSNYLRQRLENKVAERDFDEALNGILNTSGLSAWANRPALDRLVEACTKGEIS